MEESFQMISVPTPVAPESEVIEVGDLVGIVYQLETEDEVVEFASEQAPFLIQVGSGVLHPALEASLVGRRRGDTLELRLDPSLAFGDRNEDLVIKIAKTKLPSHLQSCQVGEGFEAPGPDRKKHWFRCVENANAQMVFDGNHPLAGQTLEWTARIVSISKT